MSEIKTWETITRCHICKRELCYSEDNGYYCKYCQIARSPTMVGHTPTNNIPHITGKQLKDCRMVFDGIINNGNTFPLLYTRITCPYCKKSCDVSNSSLIYGRDNSVKCPSCSELFIPDGKSIWSVGEEMARINPICPNCEKTTMTVQDGKYHCAYCEVGSKDITSNNIPHISSNPPVDFPKCEKCGNTMIHTAIETYCPNRVGKCETEDKTEQYFRELLDEAFELWRKKHQSYGPYNISAFGERGILVRVYDKLQRLVRLVWNGVSNHLSETQEDAWLDTAVYCLIAILVRRGKWPTMPGGEHEMSQVQKGT